MLPFNNFKVTSDLWQSFVVLSTEISYSIKSKAFNSFKQTTKRNAMLSSQLNKEMYLLSFLYWQVHTGGTPNPMANKYTS